MFGVLALLALAPVSAVPDAVQITSEGDASPKRQRALTTHLQQSIRAVWGDKPVLRSVNGPRAFAIELAWSSAERVVVRVRHAGVLMAERSIGAQDLEVAQATAWLVVKSTIQRGLLSARRASRAIPSAARPTPEPAAPPATLSASRPADERTPAIPASAVSVRRLPAERPLPTPAAPPRDHAPPPVVERSPAARSTPTTAAVERAPSAQSAPSRDAPDAPPRDVPDAPPRDVPATGASILSNPEPPAPSARPAATAPLSDATPSVPPSPEGWSLSLGAATVLTSPASEVGVRAGVSAPLGDLLLAGAAVEYHGLALASGGGRIDRFPLRAWIGLRSPLRSVSMTLGAYAAADLKLMRSSSAQRFAIGADAGPLLRLRLPFAALGQGDFALLAEGSIGVRIRRQQILLDGGPSEEAPWFGSVFAGVDWRWR
ncbi:MAG: hypothetical protein IT384_11450 [Deltaproteobacteria bacterium]|nr:hypothetical protein [Deltaproteobacteria bacterium]